jgi:precorrin-3B synthase
MIPREVPVTSSALDACPGVLVLHPARDGQVARIRLPGGYLSGPRWRALAGLAATFGDGCLDLTSRGNIQLRGLRPDDAAALAQRAARAGLLPSVAHDRARNIMASPLAGLGGRASLRDLVRRLDAALLGDPGFAALPGRFLFSLDDGSGGAGLAGCDVGLRRAAGGVEVVVAGRRTGVRVPVAAATGVAATAARAAISGGVGGGATRIADLADGGESVAAAIGGSLGAAAAGPDSRLPLGRPGQDGTPRHRTRPDDETLVLAAPLGRLSVSQAMLIAACLRPREIIRMGVAGRLVLPLAASAAATGRLADAGLLVSGADARAGVTACSGAACSRSVADVRAAASPVPGHARTHWVGCARQCGCPPDAEPVIAVDADRYLISGHDGPQPLETLIGVS